MYFELDLVPSTLTFTEPLDGGPFPYLIDVGALRQQVRAGFLEGIGVAETPSLSVTLSNDGNRVAGIVRQPFRTRGRVFDDAGALYFAGYVTDVVYGRTVELILDA